MIIHADGRPRRPGDPRRGCVPAHMTGNQPGQRPSANPEPALTCAGLSEAKQRCDRVMRQSSRGIPAKLPERCLNGASPRPRRTQPSGRIPNGRSRSSKSAPWRSSCAPFLAISVHCGGTPIIGIPNYWISPGRGAGTAAGRGLRLRSRLLSPSCHSSVSHHPSGARNDAPRPIHSVTNNSHRAAGTVTCICRRGGCRRDPADSQVPQ